MCRNIRIVDKKYTCIQDHKPNDISIQKQIKEKTEKR